MDMKNWNVDKTQIAAQQEALKKKHEFCLCGPRPKSHGLYGKAV